MAAAPGTRWIVGTATELGELEERLADADATVRETWPGGANAAIVALVEVTADDVDAATEALGTDAADFDDEQAARRAARELVAGGGS